MPSPSRLQHVTKSSLPSSRAPTGPSVRRTEEARACLGAIVSARLDAPHLELRHLTKVYGDQAAVADVSVGIGEGRFVTLLGPSGSGKTTILMAIAGFVAPTSGEVMLSGRPITLLPPERRNFGMVFQGYALFPNMTVEENVWFPLRVRGKALAAARPAVQRILELVHMTPFAKRLPRELSGGQQQRAALARALIFEPELLLLDEPLSALDKQLRTELQWELKSLHRRLGSTFINVTHDQDEALALSDEIVILRGGRVEQVGTPSVLYAQPATRFVASFLGESNFLNGRIVDVGRDGFRYSVGRQTFVQTGPAPQQRGTEVTIALRPERIDIATVAAEGPNAIAGRVVDFRYHGSNFLVQVQTDVAGTVLVRMATAQAKFAPEAGMSVNLGWGPDMGVPVQGD
jgi:putative spermidine/putrescine transport system ATP-binding protein